MFKKLVDGRTKIYVFNPTRSFATETNQRKILDNKAKELNFTQLSDWYSLSPQDFQDKTGLKTEANTPYDILSSVYPEYEWVVWKFTKPNYFWADPKNHRKYMDWVATQLNVKDMSDWYNVQQQDIERLNGTALLKRHRSSLYNLLQTVYPDYNWLPWKFIKVPRGFFDDPNNQRKFMDWAGKELNVKEMSDWYKVSYKDITRIGGYRVLSRNNASLYQTLQSVYPDTEWLFWRFDQAPRHHWHKIENQRKFMEWVGKDLKIKDMSDWYNVTLKDYLEVGAGSIIRIHQSSPFRMLSAIFPDYEWIPWKFPKRPTADLVMTKKIVERIEKELKIKDREDWYNVSFSDICKYDGDYVYKAYNRSLFKLLSAVYPDYKWLPWKFTKTRMFYWSDINNWITFLDYAAKELNIKDMSDWYNVKTEQFIDLGGGSLVVQHGSLSQLLTSLYPEYIWDSTLFNNNVDIWSNEKLVDYFIQWLKKQSDVELSYLNRCVRAFRRKESCTLTRSLKEAFPNYNWFSIQPSKAKKMQYMLKECIETMFSKKDTLLLQEYRHPDLNYLELDFFLPQFNLAIECQGRQHYESVNVFNRALSTESFKVRDQRKIDVCKEKGITLIEVPHWWDRKLDSLAATIYAARPDLFDKKPISNPIPMKNTIEKSALKNASKANKILMTAVDWDPTMDSNGWYLTEKYDGMRLYWNGAQFFSRQGEKIEVPTSITNEMPRNVSLDGELWTQYGLYQDAVGVSKSVQEDRWNRALFWIFDVPSIGDKPIEERIKFLGQLKLPPFAKVVDFVKCEGNDHFQKFQNDIIAKGGEGVILREPGSAYKPGRSKSLRRSKVYFDTEVLVIKNQYPHGFACEMPTGKKLFVNLSSEYAETAKLIKAGTVITVKHSGANVHGTLLYPQFYRERLDLSWQDVIKSI